MKIHNFKQLILVKERKRKEDRNKDKQRKND